MDQAMLYDKVFEVAGQLKGVAHSTLMDMVKYFPQAQAIFGAEGGDGERARQRGAPATESTGDSDSGGGGSFARSASQAASAILGRKFSKKE